MTGHYDFMFEPNNWFILCVLYICTFCNSDLVSRSVEWNLNDPQVAELAEWPPAVLW